MQYSKMLRDILHAYIVHTRFSIESLGFTEGQDNEKDEDSQDH